MSAIKKQNSRIVYGGILTLFVLILLKSLIWLGSNAQNSDKVESNIYARLIQLTLKKKLIAQIIPIP